jgi:flagellar biogenesis protein FliO
VIERLQLTPQHALCLVQLGQRTLLIGTSPTSCDVLDEHRRDEEESA